MAASAEDVWKSLEAQRPSTDAFITFKIHPFRAEPDTSVFALETEKVVNFVVCFRVLLLWRRVLATCAHPHENIFELARATSGIAARSSYLACARVCLARYTQEDG